MYGLFLETRLVKNLMRQEKFPSLEHDLEKLKSLTKSPDNKMRQKGLESMAILIIR